MEPPIGSEEEKRLAYLRRYDFGHEPDVRYCHGIPEQSVFCHHCDGLWQESMYGADEDDQQHPDICEYSDV